MPEDNVGEGPKTSVGPQVDWLPNSPGHADISENTEDEPAVIRAKCKMCISIYSGKCPE